MSRRTPWPWLLALGAASCRPPPPAPVAPIEAIDVAGCGAVRADGVCEVGDAGVLTLFSPGRLDGAARAFLTTSPRALPVTVEPTAEGTRLRVSVPAHPTGTLRVDVGLRRFRVELGASTRPPWWVAARAARASGDTAGARRALEAAAPSGPVDEARRDGLLARLSLDEGRLDESIPLFSRAIERHAAAGRRSEEAEDRFALSFVLAQLAYRFAEARAALEPLSTRLEGPAFAESRARLHHYRAVVALAAFDLRAHLAELSACKAEAARLGLVRDQDDAEEMAALALLGLGRADAARHRFAELDRVAAARTAPCARVDRLLNLALAARRSGATKEAAAALDTARALTDTTCRGALRRANLLAEQAELALATGDAALARTSIDGALLASPPPGLRIELDDARGRAALASGDRPGARVAFEEARSRSSELGHLEGVWSALLGLARVALTDGDAKEAERHLLGAEAALDALADRLPALLGHGSLATAHLEGTRLLLAAVLVTPGRAGEALAIVRHARRRGLRTLHHRLTVSAMSPATRARWEAAAGAYLAVRARLEEEAEQDWSLEAATRESRRKARALREAAARVTLDQLQGELLGPAPSGGPETAPPDAALLAWWPTKDGVVALVRRDATTTKVLLPATGFSAVVPALDAALAGARRVRLLPFFAEGLAVHRAPALAAYDVEYALDVAASDDVAAGPALVVSDPAGDLPRARAEGDAVATWLGEGTRHLRGREATLAALRGALIDARLFHFAGHAVVDEARNDAWLVLAEGGHLGLADLLAARPRTGLVVLSACDASTTTEEGATELPGIAQTFVLAGARAAIAPTRPVSDAVAASVSLAVYAGLRDGLSPTASLAQAQRALAQPDADAYRVLVP